MKTKKKISPLRISPFFCPKLGEDQKKNGFHSILVWFLAQNFVKTKDKKKRSLPRFSPFVCSNFLSKLQRRWPCRNFAYYSMLIILSWRPKGGAWHHSPLPLKYAPGFSSPRPYLCRPCRVYRIRLYMRL